VDLLQEHMQRKADHARAIWTLCVLCEWLEWVSEATAETPKIL
jgi:asparagine synthase (glutamine-hydrolysing)